MKIESVMVQNVKNQSIRGYLPLEVWKYLDIYQGIDEETKKDELLELARLSNGMFGNAVSELLLVNSISDDNVIYCRAIAMCGEDTFATDQVIVEIDAYVYGGLTKNEFDYVSSIREYLSKQQSRSDKELASGYSHWDKLKSGDVTTRYIKELLSRPQKSSLGYLLEKMSKEGGMVINTADMDEDMISQARASGRLYVDSDGLGFAWIPRLNMPTTAEEVRKFEEYYPLDVEVPDFSFDKLWEQIQTRSSKDPNA